MSDLRMPTINTVSLTGRLVQDPDFKITENGTARLSGRIAVNRPYRDRDGQWQTESSFVNIVIWREFAESLADRLHKGSPVFLSGRLRSSSWKDSDDNPHSTVEIQVRTLLRISEQIYQSFRLKITTDFGSNLPPNSV